MTAYTSMLSTQELLLVREAGFRPLTQVMGSCFYHVGWQGIPYAGSMWGQGQTFELETQTEAWNEARRLALERLAGEAQRADADAVVGVRLERGTYDWAAGTIEFVATGTAVASERYELGPQPVLSNLSGQEFAKLYRHGYWPAGLVAGTTACFVATGWRQRQMTSILGGAWQNQELPDFTQGLYDARAQAMRRLERQAHELGASGVVGVAIERAEHEVEVNDVTCLIVTMHVLGTAIVELAAPQEQPPVYVALPLEEP
ncbi:MAG TPA: heavy metal-binding domain-containing protein [Gaiellaceae bacterium]|nr:heavy metal-binding domain-containing protein [Gaiellaceae bacterium]